MQPMFRSLLSAHGVNAFIHGTGIRLQVVDADTQKAMLAWYYKKQEEEKVRVPTAARCSCLMGKQKRPPHAARGKAHRPCKSLRC